MGGLISELVLLISGLNRELYWNPPVLNYLTLKEPISLGSFCEFIRRLKEE